MKIRPKFVIALLVAALCSIHAPALANGSADPDFNNGSFVLEDGGLFQEAKAIAQQGNKIIVAGSREDSANWDFLVARFTSTGELDLSFGANSNGYVTLDVNGGSYDLGIDLAITSSNEIYVYGSTAENLTIVKLNADGTHSSSFGISGVKTILATTWGAYDLIPKDIEIFGEWVYFAAAYRQNIGGPGSWRYGLYRMSHVGNIDLVFSQAILDLGINGFLGAMKVDSSGNIYLAGDDSFSPLVNARIVKIDSVGGLVNSFAGTGIKDIQIFSKQDSTHLNSFVTQLKISNSGQIFAVGSSYDSIFTLYEVFVVNFDSAGQISQFSGSDYTSLFDASQNLFTSGDESIALQNDGKFLVSTNWTNSTTMATSGVVVRFNSTGDLDTSFGVDGRVSLPDNYFVNSIQMQANQRLVAAGRFGNLSSSDLFLSRLRTALPSGAPIIGTATATGARTATVSFTAPISNGGATITGYTATSSPGGFTGTLAGATAGTITVTGLSASTAYTFTVTATNSEGVSAASSASNSITTSTVSGGTTTSTTAADELRRQQEAAQAAKQKQDQELKEILSLVPTIAGLAQGISGLGNSLLLPKKCVKGKLVKNVKAGAKCPKGYKVRK